MRINRRVAMLAIAAASAFALAGPGVAEESPERMKINAGADGALETLYAENPTAREIAKKAVGILIFPQIVKAGFVVGGQTGDGVLRIDGKPVEYYNTSSASIGFQAGVQSYSEVLMFLEKGALEKFRSSKGWEAGVDGSIAILEKGVGASMGTATTKAPIVGYIFGEQGLMASASLEGSKFTKIDP